MAEKYSSPSSTDVSVILADQNSTLSPERDNLLYGNFQPNENRQEAIHHIGEIAAAVAFWYVAEDGSTQESTLHQGDVLSSELLRTNEDAKGNIDMLFKQYRLGYGGDAYGIPHSGYRGIETISVLGARWNARTQSAEAQYIMARNFRYILIDHRTKKLKTEL